MLLYMHKGSHISKQARSDMYGDAWMSLARAGNIYIPTRLVGEIAETVYLILREHWHSGNVPLTLYIDCLEGGDEHAWDVIGEVARLECLTVVLGKAVSAGLLIACAGAKGNRKAAFGATFVHHAHYKPLPGSNEEAENIRTFTFMGDHTNKPYVWWEEKCEGGAPFAFDATEALEFGVVDELADVSTL